MRSFLPPAVLLAALVAPGCFGPACRQPHLPTTDCSYGPGPAVASSHFLDEAWNATILREAFEATSFAVEGEGDVVRGVAGNASLMADREHNGTVRVSIEFRLAHASLGYTYEEARAEVAALRAASGPNADRLLAEFEAKTGWTHDAEVGWVEAIIVT